MKKINFITILFALFIASCQKETANSISKLTNSPIQTFRSELNYKTDESYGLFFKDSHGGINFKSTKQYYNQNKSDWDCVAWFSKNLRSTYNQSNRIYENVGNVSIGSVSIPKITSNGYIITNFSDANKYQFNSYLGQTVTFSINGSTTSSYTQQTSSLYIPIPLNIKFIGDNTKVNGRPVLRKNSLLNLKWDADPANSKGVIVIIENMEDINPDGTPNYKHISTKTNNALLLSDDGDYMFKYEDLSNLPLNTQLRFTVIRGNIAIVTNNNRTIRIYGGEEIFANQYILMP